MRFRLQLYSLVVAFAVSAAAVEAGLTYVELKREVLRLMGTGALSIASTASLMLPGDDHQLIRTQQDGVYRNLLSRLRRVRNANRQAELPVREMYTIRPSANRACEAEFVLDANESPANVGECYTGQGGNPVEFNRPSADQSFSTDKWGTWLTATAPVRNAQGVAVAAVGVDLDARDVQAYIRKAVLQTFAAVLLAVVLISAIAIRWSQRLAKPVEALQGAFERYVSKHVMESIVRSGHQPALTGERRTITVLFADVCGFTSASESIAPEQVVAALNDYFEQMIQIAFRHSGTVDKFMGDGLMLVFGAPIEDQKQEENAVHAALAMQKALPSLSERLRAKGLPPIRIGIGINSGPAVVGNVGSSARMEYTAIGDTVNVASRLESATRELNCEILISESTYEAVRFGVIASSKGTIRLKGRSQPVAAYAVEGLRGTVARQSGCAGHN